MKKILVFTGIALLTAAAPAWSASEIKMTTYAEGTLEMRPDASNNWQVSPNSAGSNPKSFFELKLDITPFKNWAIWAKMNASTASDDRYKPRVFSDYDLNLRYTEQAGGSGFELITYMREDSHFWMDQPLNRLTDDGGSHGTGDDKGEKGSMSGVFFNSWNTLGLNLLRAYLVQQTMVTADKPNYTFALRGRKDLAAGRLKIGATGVVVGDPSKKRDDRLYRAVFADVDTSLLSPFQLAVEGGYAVAPRETPQPASAGLQYSYKAELRGNFGLGAFGQTGFFLSSYLATQYFNNWRGSGAEGDDQDRFVERLEWFYNFPLKAITLKNVFFYSHSVAGFSPDRFHVWSYDWSYNNSRDATAENYMELYTEFKNGFRSKIYWKHTEGGEYRSGLKGVWDSLFFQLEMENAFAKIRPMVLLLNINDSYNSAQAYGGEVLVNLSEKVKFYSRVAMVSGSESSLYRSVGAGDKANKKNWAAFFCEMQFLQVFSNTDIYVTYGTGDQTNDDVVHDKNGGILVGNQTENRFNVYLKFWL